MEGYRSLHFNTTGEFVTNHARTLFYQEGRPYEEVEDFLLACMSGTDTPLTMLKKYAKMVLMGEARFDGSTADGSYCLTILDDPEEGFDIFGHCEKLKQKLSDVQAREEKAEKCLQNLRDALVAITDEAYEDVAEYLTGQTGDLFTLKKLLLNQGNLGLELCTTKVETGNSLVDSYLQQAKIEKEFEDNYGWLSPAGDFYPVDWGGHQVWAERKACELGILPKQPLSGDGGDILVTHGWVLLHNPSMGVAMVTRNEAKPLTKKQREFLFGYYTDRGLSEEAEKYLQED